jgi:hypothetical protein
VEHHLHDPEGPHEPIPGERDASTLTHREPGAIGGRFSGADTPSSASRALMDDETLRLHRLEGGGTEVDES